MEGLVVSNALSKPAGTPPAIEEYAYVVLTRDVDADGVRYPSGTRGVVAHRHDDRVGYEVEFETPRFAVLTLTVRDIEAA
jgi:hypothetical protein